MATRRSETKDFAVLWTVRVKPKRSGFSSPGWGFGPERSFLNFSKTLVLSPKIRKVKTLSRKKYTFLLWSLTVVKGAAADTRREPRRAEETTDPTAAVRVVPRRATY